MTGFTQVLLSRPEFAHSAGRFCRSSFSLCAAGVPTLDVLSDVLRAIRLTGAIYFDIRARSPWIAATPDLASIRAKVMPGFEHVIAFHVLLGGSCWVELTDEAHSPVRLVAGDAVIIVRGESHVLGTERGKRVPPDLGVYYRPKDQTLPFVFNEFGGSGEPANLVCGYLGCDMHPFNPILDALPRLLHVRATSPGGHLIHDLIRVALRESDKPCAGGETILAKLSELIFLQAVRQHLNELPADATGWLSGLRDTYVGTALRLMHGRPADRWTLDGLAREVGLSRSAFSERFSALIGTPPMQYLGNWRLQLAAQHLEHGGMSIAQAAAEVGYESEAAFNRAFKKLLGSPPGSWRRARISIQRA